MNNRLWISLILVVITAAVFWPVVTHDFVALDDDAYVTHNPPVASGLSVANVQWAFTHFWSGNWHPLTWISHQVDVQVFGVKNAGGHHLTGLLFHLANVVLLFLLLSRLTGSVWKSAFVAALFGVHPLHVESVAWVAERKDVLSTFFWLLATLAYARYVEQPGTKRYVLMAVLFALGLLSKPMLVTLPVTLLLLDYWPLGRLSAETVKKEGFAAAWWPLVKEKIPLFALVVISSVITFFAQRSAGAVGTFASTPLPLRLENVVISYARYLVKMVWPDGLGVYYPYYSNLLVGGDSQGWLAIAVAVSIALPLAVLTWLIVRAPQRRGYLTFGWLWYLITLVPVIGLIQVGGQSMADRYTYVPLIGIFVMVAWGIPELFARPERQTRGRSRSARKPEESRGRAIGLSIAATTVVAIFMVCTWIQVGYWKDGITLFTRTIAVTGPNDIMQNNMGVEYFTRKKYDDAVPCFEEAIRINPDYREAQGNLANTLKELGRDQESLSPYRAVVRLKPKDATAQNNLGMALVKTGQPKEAETCFAEALKLSPKYAAAHSNLGLALSAEGRLDDALAEQRKAIKLDPKYAEAHGNLGLVYAQQGKIADAMKSWREAIRLNPDYAEGQFNLGLALSNTGKPDEAIEHLTKAVKAKPNYIKAHVTLASLLATKADYAGAWKEVKAMRENGAEPDPGFVALLSQKMPEPR